MTRAAFESLIGGRAELGGLGVLSREVGVYII